jgi:putative transposase
MRYQFLVRPDEPQIRERLRALAAQRPRWGYRRWHVLLQRELGVINHKRVYRLYRLGQLKLRQRKRKRVAVNPRAAVMAVTRPREAWAMDFMQDVLVDGRRFADLEYSRSSHPRMLGD